MDEETDRLLKTHYYQPSEAGSFGGVRALAKAKRVPYQQAKTWATLENPYSLHAPRKLKFKRNRTSVMSLNDTYQIDLCDMQQLSKYNSGFKYIMTMIDIFSRYLWAVPLKNKSGPVVAKALDRLFRKQKPLRVHTDKGREFKNGHVQRIMKKYRIHYYTTESDTKASLVERANRTLKTRLWRYFTHQGHYKYIDVLPEIVLGYNNTIHRVIKMAPAKVNIHNESDVWDTLYRKEENTREPKFKEGNLVRVSNPKQVFEKGYKGLWSHEIFLIDQVVRRIPVVYRLKDRYNEPILGIFYEAELQRVRERALPDQAFAIERVLSRRKRKGKLFLKVKWANYTKPEWIPATQLVL